MDIQLKSVKVSELVDGYSDTGEEGVRGYGGKLNIRPAYQREFIYRDKQREEVIHTARKGFPLNTMYWAKVGSSTPLPPSSFTNQNEEGEYELMDGQQRTISLCQYVQGNFAVTIEGSPYFFTNLTAEKKQAILDYELQVYVCEGEDQEKLDWFKIINIASIKLTDQELRNAIYTGPWLADAKKWFSKTGCPAYVIGEKYVTGSPIRQEFLETALEWINGGAVEPYMAAHQHDNDAESLWKHFEAVIEWVRKVFPNDTSARVRLMKGLDWGKFYRDHGARTDLNANTLETRIKELIDDEEVENKKGIYEYLLTGNEKTLNLRAFPDKIKIATYEKQQGVCRDCKKKFEIGDMEADHIKPWHEGGKTNAENCKMLCRACNRTKGGK
ncbi:MAG: DUF262 domain-containing protein [Fimbriimonadaceae bacterium]|nr:DUF262 domain-containing protein [Fimbriimonadaceae bacterium]